MYVCPETFIFIVLQLQKSTTTEKRYIYMWVLLAAICNSCGGCGDTLISGHKCIVARIIFTTAGGCGGGKILFIFWFTFARFHGIT